MLYRSPLLLIIDFKFSINNRTGRWEALIQLIRRMVHAKGSVQSVSRGVQQMLLLLPKIGSRRRQLLLMMQMVGQEELGGRRASGA